MIRRGFLVALAACAACTAADYESGHLRCAATAPMCPSGFHCASDGACWRNGEDPPPPDLAVAFDLAGERDQSVEPPEPDLAAHVDGALADDMSIAPPPADLLITDDAECLPMDPALCCGTMFNSCGGFINCTGNCANSGKLCGGAVPNQCGCPAPPRTGIYRAVANNGSTCYSTGDPTACNGFTTDPSPQFYTYLGDPPTNDTPPLLRCADSPHYTLTFNADCDGAGSVDFTIGYIPTTQACGTVALHRYSTASKGVLYFTNPADAPGGATEILPPFYVWPN